MGSRVVGKGCQNSCSENVPAGVLECHTSSGSCFFSVYMNTSAWRLNVTMWPKQRWSTSLWGQLDSPTHLFPIPYPSFHLNPLFIINLSLKLILCGLWILFFNSQDKNQETTGSRWLWRPLSFQDTSWLRKVLSFSIYPQTPLSKA